MVWQVGLYLQPFGKYPFQVHSPSNSNESKTNALFYLFITLFATLCTIFLIVFIINLYLDYFGFGEKLFKF